jgi:deazaflavin-dependent oxidoreductase (nitroreductase family)
VTAAAARNGAARRSPVRSALRRIWNVGAWLPVLADRRGLRWLLSGRLAGAPIVILTHRGRRSGRVYRTPVEAIVEDHATGEVVVSPMRGRRGDWFRNIVAGGLVEVSLRGERFRPEWRELSESENREALERYRGEHPIYGRIVLSALARLHGLDGETLPAVAGAIPMLALKLPAGRPLA